MSMGRDYLNDCAYENDYPFGQPAGRDPLWKTRTGEKIRLSQMTPAHIRNCMKIVGEDDKWFWVFRQELVNRGEALPHSFF